jgi:hypothetical protein
MLDDNLDFSKKNRTPRPPTPRRPTLAYHRMQHKKLATPFRSPFPKIAHGAVPDSSRRPADENILDNSSPTSRMCSTKPKEIRMSAAAFSSLAGSASTIVPQTRQAQKSKAGAQFKSPLSAASSSALVSSVRLTPAIQSLERKVQILKRAVKVRAEGEEGELEGLVKKWREAGREVAWEVWDLVKDRGGDDQRGGGGWGGGFAAEESDGKKRGLQEGWGWDDNDAAKKQKLDGYEGAAAAEHQLDSIDGGRSVKAYEAEEEPREDSLGTMLRQLGIDPETLGWDEQEGTFVGE